MAQKIKVVHVGCGGISAVWLGSNIVKQRVDVVAAVDLNPEAGQKKLAELGYHDIEVSDNLEAMLKKYKPDAVFDCTIPPAHRDVTITALKHGCHVLGEKPMADSLESGREMVAAAQKAGKVYAVTQSRRWNKQLHRFVRFLRSGAIGEVETVQSAFFLGAHFDGFRTEMKHVLVLDMAIHTFDAARLIAGSNPVSVICEDWNPGSSWFEHGASAMALFRLQDGVRYLYHGSWCPEGGNTSWESSWRVICSKGTAFWDGGDKLRAEVVDYDAERVGLAYKSKEIDIPESTEDSYESGHAGAITDFINCITSGSTIDTVCTDNIHSLAMVTAAIKSAERDGSRVEIKI